MLLDQCEKCDEAEHWTPIDIVVFSAVAIFTVIGIVATVLYLIR